MNIIYSDICQEILGEYSQQNSHLSQLLYLICYMSNVKSGTDVDQIKKEVKILNKEASMGIDVIHSILCDIRENMPIKSRYEEDFFIRCSLYYNDISFDKKRGKWDSDYGKKQHAKLLQNLNQICSKYCVNV